MFLKQQGHAAMCTWETLRSTTPTMAMCVPLKPERWWWLASVRSAELPLSRYLLTAFPLVTHAKGKSNSFPSLAGSVLSSQEAAQFQWLNNLPSNTKKSMYHETPPQKIMKWQHLLIMKSPEKGLCFLNTLWIFMLDLLFRSKFHRMF